MRPQRIKKARDLVVTQERWTLALECGHIASVTMREIETDSGKLTRSLQAGYFDCPFCPDAPPEVKEKSVQQLYREAGEP